MLTIYTPVTNNRLRYTFDLLLQELLGLNYQVTSNKSFFETLDSPKRTNRR